VHGIASPTRKSFYLFRDIVERTAKPAAPPATGVVPSTGRTRDIQCHHCKGFGHVIRDYPSKHTLLIHDNGEYSSASDSEETRHAMLATDHADNEEVHVAPGDANRYESCCTACS
jgi:hypothetical protein